MPRPPRSDYAGAWHHVMNRGAGGSIVFRTDQDRQLFIESLVEGMERYAVEVHGYCLLGTHYHLLLKSREGQLSAAMKFTIGRFTRLKNLKDKRDGPLFRGRFKSVDIDADADLVQVSRYIHLNPVEAGLVSAPERWIWSSAAAYLGRIACPHWLATDEILAMFGPDKVRQKYEAFLQSGIDEKTRDFYGEIS